MRIITFFCFLSLNTLGQSLDIDQVRDLFVNADKKKETCSKLLDLTDDFKENSYLAEAYNATAKMISSKHIINPYSKWTTFIDGKNKLEKVIELNPLNLEFRFLRYCIQIEAPKFLSYSSNLKEDYKFISNSLNEAPSDLSAFITPIFNYLKND